MESTLDLFKKLQQRGKIYIEMQVIGYLQHGYLGYCSENSTSVWLGGQNDMSSLINIFLQSYMKIFLTFHPSLPALTIKQKSFKLFTSRC